MRPRKPSKLDAVVQVNLRIDERLRRQLAGAAEANRVSFSREVVLRLETSFGTKTQSLADFFADFGRRVRDTVERSAPKKDIELTWRNLRKLDVTLAHTYKGVEEALALYLPYPEVRELIRGAQQEKEDNT